MHWPLAGGQPPKEAALVPEHETDLSTHLEGVADGVQPQDPDLSPVGGDDRRQDLQEGGLARPVWAQQPGAPARRDQK